MNEFPTQFIHTMSKGYQLNLVIKDCFCKNLTFFRGAFWSGIGDLLTKDNVLREGVKRLVTRAASRCL